MHTFLKGTQEEEKKLDANLISISAFHDCDFHLLLEICHLQKTGRKEGCETQKKGRGRVEEGWHVNVGDTDAQGECRSSAHTGVTGDPNIFFGWCFKPTPRRGSSVEVAATRGHDTKGLADNFQEYRTFQKEGVDCKNI